MKDKKQIVNKLILSLNNEVDDWVFNQCTVENIKWGIQLWIANTPILDLEIYQPTKLKFSLLDRIRIYRALSKCRVLKIIKLQSK